MYARNNEHGRYLTAYSAPPAAVAAQSNVFRSAEERGAPVNSRQRMSLLPPQPQSEYNIPHASAPLNPRQQDRPSQQAGHYGADNTPIKMIPLLIESPPCKKPRLGDSKSDMMPLRIDTDRTRSVPAYNPQVEAISPTLPSESMRDESPLRSTKEDLLSQIARVDREIAKTESQIAKLKKKKIELEEAATQPQRDTEETSNASDSVMQSLPQSIYAENRKKACAAHDILAKLGANNDLPMYNQPSDTPVYHENSVKYSNFKGQLVQYFKIRQKEKHRRDEYLTKTYANLSVDWVRNIEKIENSPKKKAQEAKKRELFEKIFPELRKQREDKERFSRVSRIKSDADLEEIMGELHEQEMEDKKMRSYAVIPPALLDEKTRSRRFINRNGLIEDPMQEYKDKQVFNMWTDQEKEIFKEKYLQHPKNFGCIKSYLERKCVSDCVQYYYLSKKAQNYRQLLRKSRARGTRSRTNNANNSQVLSGSISSVKNETNGVTTRQQKEQKSDIQGGSSSASAAPCAPTQGTSSAPSDPPSHTPPTSAAQTSTSIKTEELPATSQPSVSSEYSGQPRKKRKGGEEAKDNMMNEIDTSEDDTIDINGDKSGPRTCVACKTTIESYMRSRPISRSQAAQFGLNENDIQSGDRICTTCRCKSVRKRYKATQCPIPTCPAKRARIKRLRSLPSKWTEIPEERREAIIAKYQIPANVTKCCTACFNRINRRLSPNASLETPDDPGSDTTRWTDAEIELMKAALLEIGTDWKQLSERMAPKSDLQCRNFYFNFRKKYGLDAIVQEFKKSKGGDGPPTLTDEEESGSTTSSCDETGSVPHEQPTRASLMEKKDDYDSSATVSAEEEAVEVEKTNSVEEMKTLPTNPNPDSPIQLTIRPNNVTGQSTFISSQKQLQINTPHSSAASIQNVHYQSGPHNVAASQQHQQQQQLQQLQQQSATSTISMPRHQSPQGNIPQHHQQASSPSPHHLAAQGYPHNQSSQGHMSSNQAQMSGVPLHVMSPHQGRRYPSPDNGDTHEPMTVKVTDILGATIERSLRRFPANNSNSGHPGPSVSPTITSILKSQDRSHLPPPGTHHIMSQIASNHPGSVDREREQNNPHMQGNAPSPHFQQQQQQQQHQQQQQQQQQQHPGVYYGSKIDMRGIPSHHGAPPEGLSMVQGPPRDECGTLDLSMKKRSTSPHVISQRPPSNGPPPAHQPLDFTPRQQMQGDMYFQKYPNIRNRPPQQLQPPPPPKANKVPPPPPLLTKTPTVSPMKDGSITHGTPMHHQSLQMKYEGLLRPSKEGSITQGTPIDKMRGKEQIQSPYATYERTPEYYKRMSPAAPYYHGAPSPYSPYGQRPPSTGQRNSPPTGPPQPSNYASDQHNNSRQIIINDYYTSQQMQQPVMPHGSPHPSQNSMGQQPSRMDPPKRSPVSERMVGPTVYVLPRPEIPYRQSQSPSLHPQHPQQRQGVIQRVNPGRAGIKIEPGRVQEDALATLVNAAVSAPSLPVPKEDPRNRVSLPRVEVGMREGLGKSMVEIERTRMGQTPPQMYRPQMTMPPQVGQNPEIMKIERVVKPELEVNRFNREGQDQTLTAASLIDAIITHQINQPGPNDRHSPAPPSKADILFASFHRPAQPLPPNNPQSMPPSTSISHIQAMSNRNMSHNSNDKGEDVRSINHRMPQSGTWQDHINLIISNDYALGKGSSAPNVVTSGISSSHSQVQNSMPAHSQSQQQPKEEDMNSYRSFKLRIALQQREKEQMAHQQHPDERNIIRVSQSEDNQSSRPPSRPTSVHDSVSHGEENSETSIANVVSTPGNAGSGMGPSTELFMRRTGPGKEATISPIDYVKNFIMEKMRTPENNEEKGDEDKMKPNQEISTSTSISNYSGTPSSQPNHVGNISTSDRTSNSSSVEPQRYSDPSQQEDKKDEDLNKSMESDSPASMIIDESADDVKEKSGPNGASEATSTVGGSQPNYEPLTDEES